MFGNSERQREEKQEELEKETGSKSRGETHFKEAFMEPNAAEEELSVSSGLKIRRALPAWQEQLYCSFVVEE